MMYKIVAAESHPELFKSREILIVPKSIDDIWQLLLQDLSYVNALRVLAGVDTVKDLTDADVLEKLGDTDPQKEVEAKVEALGRNGVIHPRLWDLSDKARALVQEFQRMTLNELAKEFFVRQGYFKAIYVKHQIMSPVDTGDHPVHSPSIFLALIEVLNEDSKSRSDILGIPHWVYNTGLQIMEVDEELGKAYVEASAHMEAILFELFVHRCKRQEELENLHKDSLLLYS